MQGVQQALGELVKRTRTARQGGELQLIQRSSLGLDFPAMLVHGSES